MRLVGKVRFSLAAVMMLVVMAAACSALFAKARDHIPAVNQGYIRFDAPFLFVLAIVLTGLALGALKGHTAVQMMLLVTIACVGYLSLIQLAEAGAERPLLYWFQVSFAITVTLPLLARRAVKDRMERGPRRTWWKGTCEAVLFAFFTMMLVLFGILVQFLAVQIGGTVVPAVAAPRNVGTGSSTPPPPVSPANPGTPDAGTSPLKDLEPE